MCARLPARGAACTAAGDVVLVLLIERMRASTDLRFQVSDGCARALLERRQGLGARAVDAPPDGARAGGADHDRDRGLRPHQHARRPPRARSPARPRALGIPLVEVAIPPACSNDVYEQRLEQAFAVPRRSRGIDTVAFGDLFLEDVRAYREERLAAVGQARLFPLWGRDTDRARARIHRRRLRGNARSASIRACSTRPSPAAPSTGAARRTAGRRRPVRRERRVPHLRPRRADLQQRRSRAPAARSSSATASSSATSSRSEA